MCIWQCQHITGLCHTHAIQAIGQAHSGAVTAGGQGNNYAAQIWHGQHAIYAINVVAVESYDHDVIAYQTRSLGESYRGGSIEIRHRAFYIARYSSGSIYVPVITVALGSPDSGANAYGVKHTRCQTQLTFQAEHSHIHIIQIHITRTGQRSVSDLHRGGRKYVSTGHGIAFLP